jgi:hypothetical protein
LGAYSKFVSLEFQTENLLQAKMLDWLNAVTYIYFASLQFERDLEAYSLDLHIYYQLGSELEL